MPSMATDEDLISTSNILKKITDALNYLTDFTLERIFTGNQLYNYFPIGLEETINNGLYNVKKILSNIIHKIDNEEINNETKKRLYESGSSKEHLDFEGGVLEWLVENLKNLKTKPLDNIKKKLTSKVFKTINIMIDSLNSAFPILEAVKEFKENIENLSND
jgi:hypothetical protein